MAHLPVPGCVASANQHGTAQVNCHLSENVIELHVLTHIYEAVWQPSRHQHDALHPFARPVPDPRCCHRLLAQTEPMAETSNAPSPSPGLSSHSVDIYHHRILSNRSVDVGVRDVYSCVVEGKGNGARPRCPPSCRIGSRCGICRH